MLERVGKERIRFSDCCFLSIPKNGPRLVWEVTQYCPFSCEYCFTWSSPQREKFEADIDKIIPKLAKLIEVLGVSEVLITGGEPLSVTHEIVPLLTHLRKSHIPFAISTNLFDRDLFDEVRRFKPQIVNLSVDPPAPTEAHATFKSMFDHIEEKLRIIGAAGHKAKLTAVISKENYRNVPILLDFLSDAVEIHGHVEKIAFNREYPVGFAAVSQPQTKTELKPTFDAICRWSDVMSVPVTLVNWSEFHAPLQSCPAGKHILSVQQNADVTPCSLLYNISRSFRAGNLLNDPLDLIVSRLALFVRDLSRYYQKTETNTPKCSTCSMQEDCGGGCLAMLPIASNHVPRRTCELTPRRIKDHERLLLSDFHRKYHKVYSPELKHFVAPAEGLDKIVEQQMRDYVKKKLEPSDLAHTMEHIDCVVRLTKMISKEEGASLKITVPAAYFHDVASREEAMHHMHTYKSATLASEYLKKISCFTPEEIQHIVHCIITSSYGSYLLGYKPLSLEAKVVRDADWLDAIGARGIARAFVFGQAHGAKEMGYPNNDPEELPIAINMNITGPDDSPIYHFSTKLLKIQSQLETFTAKKLGAERHTFMIDFLRQYRREADLNIGGSYQYPFNLNNENAMNNNTDSTS